MPYIDKKTGKKRTSEDDILIPSLRLIQKNPNCTMAELKNNLSKEIVFFPADKELSKTRPGERMFHQIIGNLVSHSDSNKFGEYVKIYKDNKGTNHFILSQKGKQFLISIDHDKIIDSIEEYAENEDVQNSDSYDDDVNLYEYNNRVPELTKGITKNKYKTNPKLAKTVIKRSNYICEYARLIGKNHNTFITKLKVPYLEAHHLIPMKAQYDFKVNLDREENIVGLCPVCHRLVHYGSLEEKEKVLSVLYSNRIDKLKECDATIEISLPDLINKYYK